MRKDIGTKLNVLLFIDWFLPGTNSGGPVRSYTNMINYLEDDYNFYVVTRNTDYCSTDPYDSIEYNKWNKLSENLYVWYLRENQICGRQFRQIEKSIIFHKILINGIYSFKFSILPLLTFKNRKSHIVVSARGMLNPQAFSVKRFKKKLYLFLAKGFGFYKNITFHATNVEEQEYIKDIFGEDTEVIVAPNLPRRTKFSKGLINKLKISGEIKLVNLARISKEKGTLKILEIIGKINDYRIILDIYGPIYDEEYWSKCQHVINNLNNNITVNYKGSVESEKVPRILRNYDLFVMLSEGENFGHSILEAMSAGLPVLISDRTPWTDLEEKKAGWDINLAHTQDIIDVLKRIILMDSIEYREWSKSALNYAKTIINDPKILEQNKLLFAIT